VLIGGTDRPKNGAILDLNSTAKGGLLLSNVTLLNLYTIPDDFPGMTPPPADLADAKKKFTGAMVYHKGGYDIPTGIYVWNGTNWTSMEENCKSPTLTLTAPFFIKQGTSVDFSVSSDASPRCAAGETYEWFRATSPGGTAETPFGSGAGASTIFAATGTYRIKVVATSPYSAPVEKEVTVSVTADGGPDPEKLSYTYGIVGETCLDVKKTDLGKPVEVFNARIDGFPSDNFTKTYKFVHGNNYRELSLSLDDPDNLVTSITPPPASASGNTSQPFTVTFRPDVKDRVPDNGDFLTVKLYASYKDSNLEVKYAYLEIRVEDGTCICPAKINTSPETWLNFMCHNLGGLDIISPSQLITYEHHGDWYRFGAKNYSLKNEGTNNLAVTGWTYGNDNATPPYLRSIDWPDDLNSNIANPCPAGWKLPTDTDWNNVINNNSATNVPATSWTTGVTVFQNLKKLGDGLILPVAGYRYAGDGRLNDRGYAGLYWSSKTSSAGSLNSAMYLSFDSGNPGTYSTDRGHALSVRCVEKP
jgi:uncharacterized protein (TIGR02145 family)